MKNEVIRLKFIKNVKNVCDADNCCSKPIVEIDMCLNKKHTKYYLCQKHFDKLEKEIIGGEDNHE